jgi:hypothetical protein
MQQRVEPSEALERIFEVIRQEASNNPTFARKLLDAAGVTVVFSGPEAVKVADPILMAACDDYASFRGSFMSFAEKDLKAMIKGFGLATDEQVKGVKTKPKQSGLVELMWEGATRKLNERRVG